MISGVADRSGSNRDGTRQDQPFQPRARQARLSRRQHAIEPDGAFVADDRDLKPPGVILRRILLRRALLN